MLTFYTFKWNPVEMMFYFIFIIHISEVGQTQENRKVLGSRVLVCGLKSTFHTKALAPLSM